MLLSRRLGILGQRKADRDMTGAPGHGNTSQYLGDEGSRRVTGSLVNVLDEILTGKESSFEEKSLDAQEAAQNWPEGETEKGEEKNSQTLEDSFDTKSQRRYIGEVEGQLLKKKPKVKKCVHCEKQISAGNIQRHMKNLHPDLSSSDPTSESTVKSFASLEI